MTVVTEFPANVDVTQVAILSRREPGKPLGRHVYHDHRSWDFPAHRAAQLVSVSHPASGLPLHQADDHDCSTAHSLCAVVNSSAARRRLLSEQDAVRIYQRAQLLEYGDGAARVPGSSGLMACKAARELGFISSYQHAFGLEHALAALVLRPVMTGFNWYTSFDTPDPRTGLAQIAPDAVVRGGHEVVAHAIDAAARVVWFWNSWGPGWGQGGRFCLSFETWDRLLSERGDVTVPVV
jgi:hypothetical protein